jgi:hypothetical protein
MMKVAVAADHAWLVARIGSKSDHVRTTNRP